MKCIFVFLALAYLCHGSTFNNPKLDDSLPKEQYFVQKLDHFNHQDRREWKQRYFVNDTFYNPDLGGPIFLQIGGEGAISAAYVVSFEMAEYARQNGALMLALEHRFYGKSHPLPDMSVPNLVYLSSQQALADLSEFVVSKRAEYPNTNAVITFGGSYPGALAAWFRIKYPHLTQGSVASSAPVEAVVDMYEYLDVVGESLSSITGAGCDAQIRLATDEIQKMLATSSGRAQLSTLFRTCAPLTTDTKDVANFMSSLMGNWEGTVQYNRERLTSPSISELCKIMNNGSGTPLNNYVAVADVFTPAGSCIDVSYESMIDQLKNLTDWGESGVGYRQWTYQTCTQFGYFQTTDSAHQPFGDLVPLDFYFDICRDAFGLDFKPDVNETNAHYGGRKPSGTDKILFVNGSIDPWHSLSITKNVFEVDSIYIEGTAHCANMFPATAADPPTLAIAQQQIAAKIHEYLSTAP